ncbi:amidohydrolase [Marinicella sediminis]|uniref:Amidohydrolase n=1 Tax=Marinicella sediminis TaxID=1792834 RepID=A0ABV7J6P1_9GAMM|nr:amidohydrolase [Marinicella sediminis]
MKNIIRILLLSLLIHVPMVTAEIIHLKNIVGYSHDGNHLTPLNQLLFDTESGELVAASEANLKQARVVDGLGQVVLPGLHDAHGHILNYGLSRLLVDLRGFSTLDDAVKQVREYAASHADFPWILGRGWNQVLWPGKAFPTRHDLDAITQDKPVWLERIDGHAGWANSKALELAGINRETARGNDLILKDAEGIPTGVLIDNAMYLMEKQVPAITEDMKKRAISLAFKELSAVGLTFVHDAGIGHENYQQFIEMARQQVMPIRVYAMLASNDPAFKKMVEQGHLNIDNHLLVRSVKLMIDGALGSYGAIMHEPYSDQPDKQGAYVQTPEQIKAALDYLVQHDFQANVHAIGDRGNTEVIDLLSRPGMQSSKLRHRVEHAQILRLEDIMKFKDHDLIASMQPTHATSDMNMAEDRVGPERIKGAYAWQKLFKAGVVVASGSDFPVELINPFHGMHAAVTRQNHDNQPPGGWYANEAMSVAQALQTFTINAAFAAHAEDFSGSLEVGKQADFIVIDQDIFTINPQEIWKTKVLETWVGGQQVYVRESQP